jgi:glycine cleavage system regulatory protein
VPPAENAKANSPNIHLDIQIHIPVDASADQIEQIFASMAKYLYSK